MLTVAVVAGIAGFLCLCWANGRGAAICGAFCAVALAIRFLP